MTPKYNETNSTIEAFVDSLISNMTLAEKIGQMTQPDKRALEPQEVTEWFLGSVLSGGGSNPTPNNPSNWAAMVRSYTEAALETRLGIPLIYGVDGVHGHSNVVGATIFPHNIGLGATRDADLVRRIGRATALELSATGVFWNFAPCVAVPQDIRWGRTYEGFSEQTEIVKELSAAYLAGLQGDELSSAGTVMACPKHFIADGGTAWGTTPRYDWLDNYWQAIDERYKIDQGDAQMNEETLFRVHLPPYLKAIESGARSIMVSFSSWNGTKMHANHYLLTEVLKKQHGFTGFLVSDWQAISQLSRDYYTCVVDSIKAGLDMIMVPFEYQRFVTTLSQAVRAGDVPLTRVDDAVRRILKAKYDLGLFDRKTADEPRVDVVGSTEHRQLTKEAVRKSLVLLKNDRHTLPIPKSTGHIVVAGAAADSIGLQCGGWTIKWLGGKDDITQGTTILTAIKSAVSPETTIDHKQDGLFGNTDEVADIGLVVLSESPYAEGNGDRADLTLPAVDVALIERVRPYCRRLIVILFSGRPLIITDHLAKWDAFIAAWLPGTEGQGIADVLFGDFPFTGRLPYSWPKHMNQIPLRAMAESAHSPLFSFGFGLA